MANESKNNSEMGLADFSKKATRNAVITSTVQHPLTLFPVGIGILGCLAAVLFGRSFLTDVAVFGGFGLGLGTWLINYLLRSETFANEYISGLQRRIEEHNNKLLKNIESSLSELKKFSDVKEYGEQGATQFEMIQQKFEVLDQILKTKLNEGEITYRRYLGTAEQVYHSVLDNLQNIATTLKTAHNIDMDYINDRLNSLLKEKQLNQADKEEVETLQLRAKIRNEQMDRVNELLTINEKAMTELDKTTSAIANIKKTNNRASIDLESALKDLEELAGRAEKMSIRK